MSWYLHILPEVLQTICYICEHVLFGVRSYLPTLHMYILVLINDSPTYENSAVVILITYLRW